VLATTIQPPEAPLQPSGPKTIIGDNVTYENSDFLTLWPGISNDTNNLIKSTLDVNYGNVSCAGKNPKAGAWFAMASAFDNVTYLNDTGLVTD
jgi:hypothetical protein